MMDIKILYIKDQGDHDKERIVMQAVNECNIGEYILFDTTFEGEYISNKLRHSYWFPDKKIKSGDKIIVYTKPGDEGSKTNKSGNESHFFYWDLEITVWNKDEDCAIIVKVDSYKTKRIST